MLGGSQQVSFNSYIPKEPLAVPSPSHYPSHNASCTNSPKYSLRPKTTVVDKTKTIEPQNSNPGPGSYINPEMEAPSASRHTSRFHNLSYGTSKTARFDSPGTFPPRQPPFPPALASIEKSTVCTRPGSTCCRRTGEVPRPSSTETGGSPCSTKFTGRNWKGRAPDTTPCPPSSGSTTGTSTASSGTPKGAGTAGPCGPAKTLLADALP
jgi:hypothetical protein